MFYVYAIKNEYGKIYIGQTSNLNNRLDSHNGVFQKKRTSFTGKNKGNWTFVYQEKCVSRGEALMREKQLKSYQGRKFIRSLVK